MRILIDTNILLDFLCKREPYYEMSIKVFELCINGQVDGCIATHSVTNIFYILRKYCNVEVRRSMLIRLFDIFEVESLTKDKLFSALNNNLFEDFEDCLQVECAKGYYADYIISRNIKDFVNSSIPCMEPQAFLQMIDNI